jgi:GGDEF domain-containing protein
VVAAVETAIRRRRCELVRRPNRRHFPDRMAQRSVRGQSCTLCVCDLDRFGQIHDSPGHEKGDRGVRRWHAGGRRPCAPGGHPRALAAADLLLYQSKRKGGNCISGFGPLFAGCC